MNKLTDQQLIKILTEASNAYYNTDTKIMSDDEFDDLEREYQRRFKKKFIGAEPLEGKGTINVTHSYGDLVGTLSKCKNIDDFMDWYLDAFNKITCNYNHSNHNYLPELYLTLKYDGNSVVIEYKDGKVVKALTRGKNGKGLDLTHVFKDYHELEYIKEECGIKYEVIMTYENFKKLMKDENISYANPRSIVAGKLGCDDAVKYADYFTLVPLWIKYKDKTLTKDEQRDLLNKEFGIEYTDLVGNYSDSILKAKDDWDGVRRAITSYYEKIQSIRQDLPFMIDGIVIELVDENIRKELGMNTGFPNWGTALKFPYMEKTSKVVKFDYCLGDSGRITPRVWFKPVEFNGTVHQKQSLQNYKRYKELNLSIGSDILVQYSNDCLSYIERLETANNKELDKKKKEEIILCPECGAKAEANENETFLFCPNNNCPGKIVGKLQNYLTKMDIKGIKENMLTAFKEAGLVHNIEDLYTMDYSKIADIDRMGEKVAENVKKAINSKVPYDYEILGAMGIENCSLTTAKDICKVYTLKELINLFNTIERKQFLYKLMDVEGIAEITAKYVYSGIEENYNTIKFLLNKNHKNYKESIKTASKQEVFVFTGFRDKQLQADLESKGHKVTGSVSNKTTVLVAKDPSGRSSSLEKARKLNIPIITPDQCKNQY